MTNISKHALHQNQLSQLFQQMNTVLGSLNKNQVSYFLDDLLGAEEKIMLAKRLAAIVMCIEGYTPYRIWKTLKISPSTAERIRDMYTDGVYSHIEKALKKDNMNYESFCKKIEIILNAGFTPRYGNRWKKSTHLMLKE